MTPPRRWSLGNTPARAAVTDSGNVFDGILNSSMNAEARESKGRPFLSLYTDPYVQRRVHASAQLQNRRRTESKREGQKVTMWGKRAVGRKEREER